MALPLLLDHLTTHVTTRPYTNCDGQRVGLRGRSYPARISTRVVRPILEHSMAIHSTALALVLITATHAVAAPTAQNYVWHGGVTVYGAAVAGPNKPKIA